MHSPGAVRDSLCLRLAARRYEVFCVVFLAAQNRVIALKEMFRGRLTQTSVYPREVVIEGLNRGAAGVILCHNRPSGVAEPSRADEAALSSFCRRSTPGELSLAGRFCFLAKEFQSWLNKSITSHAGTRSTCSRRMHSALRQAFLRVATVLQTNAFIDVRAHKHQHKWNRWVTSLDVTGVNGRPVTRLSPFCQIERPDVFFMAGVAAIVQVEW